MALGIRGREETGCVRTVERGRGPVLFRPERSEGYLSTTIRFDCVPLGVFSWTKYGPLGRLVARNCFS